MLPVSLDCPFLITPSVFSNVYLTSSKQYFSYIHELTVNKQYIMQVHWWHYIYIITFLVSNVPCVSGLSILDLPLRLQFSLSYICSCFIMVIDRHVYWTPWYSWNIAKVGIKHQSINQCISVCYHHYHHSCPPVDNGFRAIIFLLIILLTIIISTEYMWGLILSILI